MERQPVRWHIAGMAKTPKKPARGRPRKQDGQGRGYKLQVRLTSAERDLLDAAAQSKALDTSAWVRSEMLALARQLLRTDPGAHESR